MLGFERMLRCRSDPGIAIVQVRREFVVSAADDLAAHFDLAAHAPSFFRRTLPTSCRGPCADNGRN